MTEELLRQIIADNLDFCKAEIQRIETRKKLVDMQKALQEEYQSVSEDICLLTKKKEELLKDINRVSKDLSSILKKYSNNILFYRVITRRENNISIYDKDLMSW